MLSSLAFSYSESSPESAFGKQRGADRLLLFFALLAFAVVFFWPHTAK
jgi:hypothetical protein